jgi:hypothetical protein
VPRLPIVRRLSALCVVLAACGGSPAATTSTSAWLGAAREYAATADRALDGTRFDAMTVGDIADGVVAVCQDPGPLDRAVMTVVAATAAPAGPASDDEILTEVLTEGAREACPDRVGAATLATAYLAAVRDAAVSVDPSAVIDDEAVVAAGTAACDLLDRDQGPESALLAVVAALFGVEATSVAELRDRLTGTQGVIAGATLGAAVAYLCSSHQSEVQAYLAGLG